MTTAILVARLASYRALFTRTDRPPELPDVKRDNSNAHKAFLKGMLTSKKSEKTFSVESMESRSTVYNVNIIGQTGSNHSVDGYNAKDKPEPLEFGLPMNAIHVRSDISNTFSSHER